MDEQEIMKHIIIELDKDDMLIEFEAEYLSVFLEDNFTNKLTDEDMSRIASAIRSNELLWEMYYAILRDVIEELHPEIKDLL